jgi:hypothetical protein
MKEIEMEKPGVRIITAKESIACHEPMNLAIVVRGDFANRAYLLDGEFDWIVGICEDRPLLVPVKKDGGKS